MQNYDIAKQAVKETERLTQARRDFDDLKKEEKKYLLDREQKAQTLLVGINKQTETANKLLDSVLDRVFNQFDNYKERFEKFARGLNSVVDRADKMTESVINLQKKVEKTESFIKEKYKELENFEKELSSKEKDIISREKIVEQINKEADEKLYEAQKLADWVKKGKRYTIHRKK